MNIGIRYNYNNMDGWEYAMVMRGETRMNLYCGFTSFLRPRIEPMNSNIRHTTHVVLGGAGTRNRTCITGLEGSELQSVPVSSTCPFPISEL
jgi:hypothetical protein